MKESEFTDRLKNTGRNDSCPCGSGKKYKKCHLQKDEALEIAAVKKAEVTKADTEEEHAEHKHEGAKPVSHDENAPKVKPKKSVQRINVPRRAGGGG
jgi:hypothetical protein